MAEGFVGDPFHEGSSKPMSGLKGGMDGVHTQQPMQGDNDSNSNQHDAPAAGWASTSLGVTPSGTGANNKKPH